MRVLIVCNAPASNERWAAESLSDRAVEGMAEAVAAALRELGHQTKLVQVGYDPLPLISTIGQFKPDAAFNFCETIGGESHLEPCVPYLLEWLGVPYSGNAARAFPLLVDKPLTKHLLRGLRIPTPAFAALESERDLSRFRSWPAILKPAAEDASLGIDRGSIVDGLPAARQRFGMLAERFGTPVLIERFIEGRELNVALLETADGLRCGINEIDFSSLPKGMPQILTYDAKWVEDSDEFIKTPVRPGVKLDPELDSRVRRIALKTFATLGLRGYARVDFRIDRQNRPWVLEVNPNPDISPDAGFSKALPSMSPPEARSKGHGSRIATGRRIGLTYREAIGHLLETALRHAPSRIGPGTNGHSGNRKPG